MERFSKLVISKEQAKNLEFDFFHQLRNKKCKNYQRIFKK
jgi:hypothetical protein